MPDLSNITKNNMWKCFGILFCCFSIFINWFNREVVWTWSRLCLWNSSPCGASAVDHLIKLYFSWHMACSDWQLGFALCSGFVSGPKWPPQNGRHSRRRMGQRWSARHAAHHDAFDLLPDPPLHAWAPPATHILTSSKHWMWPSLALHLSVHASPPPRPLPFGRLATCSGADQYTFTSEGYRFLLQENQMTHSVSYLTTDWKFAKGEKQQEKSFDSQCFRAGIFKVFVLSIQQPP